MGSKLRSQSLTQTLILTHRIKSWWVVLFFVCFFKKDKSQAWCHTAEIPKLQEFKVALNDIKPRVKREQEDGEKRENRKKNRGSPELQLNTKSSEPTHF